MAHDSLFNIIGSRKEKPVWTLDEVAMTAEEIEAERKRQALQPVPDAGAEKRNAKPEVTQPNLNIEADDIKRFEQVGLTPKDVIVLPSRVHGSYSYETLGVSMYRLGETDKVKQTAQTLGINYVNTALESTSGRNYLGNVNWNNALRLNLALGGLALPLREFADFYLLLRDGKEGKVEVRNLENGVVGRDKLAEILDEISAIRDPWRSEWFDANFKFLDASGNVDPTKKGKFHMLRKHVLNGGVLVHSDKVELIDSNYISSTDCKVNADSFTEYGLPTVQGNDFSYWYPRKDNNSVARFVAYSDWAGLNCNRGPTYTDASLGVRFARRVAPSVAQVKNGGIK